jgi:NAD(P)-dependent dehydrogenase (short-subunit alcohol dehydrogenase family)
MVKNQTLDVFAFVCCFHTVAYLPTVVTMAGTVILTGANGSAGLHAAEHLLEGYPTLTLIFTVRSAAASDTNTENVRRIVSKHPTSKASIHEVDLANLEAVFQFATDISARVADGLYPPLKSIICNASCWNLVGDPEYTVDGYEKTIQVCHIAHVAIILRLIDRFATGNGRIVLVSSVGHFRRKTHMSPYIPDLPSDLNQLLHPAPDHHKQGRGFQIYSISKLVITTWMYALDKYLQQVSTPMVIRVT